MSSCLYRCSKQKTVHAPHNLQPALAANERKPFLKQQLGGVSNRSRKRPWRYGDRLTLPACPFIKRLHYLLTHSDTFTGRTLSQPPGKQQTRCGTPGTHQALIWRATSPSSWGMGAGITSPDSRAYLLFLLAPLSLPLLYNQGTSLFHSFSHH